MAKTYPIPTALYFACCRLSSALAASVAWWPATPRGHLAQLTQQLVDACEDRSPSRLPAGLPRRLILAEDRRFLAHRGVDPRAVCRAILERSRGKSQGASTITMQLVRVVTGRYEKSWRRKIREAVLASMLARRVSRTAVLRAYLRHAYVGRTGNGWQAFLAQASSSPGDLRSTFVAAIRYPIPAGPRDMLAARRTRRIRWIDSVAGCHDLHGPGQATNG